LTGKAVADGRLPFSSWYLTNVSSLGAIDPLGIPLPHGTEVTTRAEKLAFGRRVPQGTVGRVVRSRDGGCDVLVIGVGELWYPRAKLLPRRQGQVRFARRREAAWEALRPCVVLEATVGSRAWGLSDESSDTDTRGIFALPLSWTAGLAEPPRDLVSADGSSSFWEVRKAIEQALRADPNTLEVFFLPEVRALDPIGEWLLQERDAFVSREIFGSFGRYAVSQLRKLTRSVHLAEHRDVVLDWLREEDPGLDAIAEKLADAFPKPELTRANAVLAAKDYVKQLYRSLHDQGLLAANDFISLVQYARGGGQRPPPAREFRPKNAYNLLRLILTAIEWLRIGTPKFVIEGPARDRMLAIKQGLVDLPEGLAEAEQLVPALEAARDVSPLPLGPDYELANRLARRIGEELAKRWVAREPGPFGRDAPPAPEWSTGESE
jgi:RNA repair pathway DNA polymerase beta family